MDNPLLPLLDLRDQSIDPPPIRLDQLQEKPLDWLWPHRIALGKLTLLAGPSGLGKSLLALDFAARVSAGLPWPDEPASETPPAGVVLVTDDGSLADTVIPRLKTAGADLGRIRAVSSLGQDRHPLERTLSPTDPSAPKPPPPFFRRLETAVLDTPDCRLVVIDPVFRTGHYSIALGHTGATISLAPLCRLAARHHFALLAVAPIRNLVTSQAVLDAANGLPSATVAATIWGTTADRYDPDRRLFLPLKSTINHNTPALAYKITSEDIPPKMGTGSEHQQPKPDQNPSSRGACPLFPQPDCPPRIQWEHTPVDISLEDAFDLRETHADRRDAVQWLQAALAPGPTPATDVLEQAEANGITPRSARTALAAVGGSRFRKGFGPGSTWYWALNNQQAQTQAPQPPPSTDDPNQHQTTNTASVDNPETNPQNAPHIT